MAMVSSCLNDCSSRSTAKVPKSLEIISSIDEVLWKTFRCSIFLIKPKRGTKKLNVLGVLLELL